MFVEQNTTEVTGMINDETKHKLRDLNLSEVITLLLFLAAALPAYCQN
jgi:hypothetical protein